MVYSYRVKGTARAVDTLAGRLENMRAVDDPRAYPARTLAGRIVSGFFIWRNE
jgi:hypothetical protein